MSVKHSKEGGRARPRKNALLTILAFGLVLDPACRGDRDRRLEEVFDAAEAPGPEATARLEPFLGNPDGSVRAAALAALGTANPAAAHGRALEMTGDPDAAVRAACARLLGRSQDAAGAAALERMLQDGEARVRVPAAEALGAIDDTAAVPALARALDDATVNVRLAALGALARIGPAPALDAVAARLENDAAWEVRAGAASALAEAAVPEAYPPLEAALLDPNEFVRASAAKAIRTLRSKGVARPEPGASPSPSPAS